MRKILILLLISTLFIKPRESNASTIHLTFYDRSGIRMTGTEAKLVMSAAGKGWDSDALIDPNTLQQLVDLPLMISSEDLSFTLLKQPVALEINWPTVKGYSCVILDNGGAGFTTAASINFTYQVAHDAIGHLNLALANRPTYKHSSSFEAFYKRALYYLALADRSTDESIRGKNGQLALDNVAQAMDILLREYGPVFAYDQLEFRSPWIGFTIDDISNYKTKLKLAYNLAGPYTWIRLVLDPNRSTSYYSDTIKVAHKMGIKIMVLPVDSTYDKQYTDSLYEQRIEQFVDKFPEVDAWEIGNEVNGNWLSSTISTRVAKAAAYVKANSSAKVVLTLYWEMGTGNSQHSIFNWARANLSQVTRSNIDVVLLSMYVENAPMGLAFDQVMRQLQQEFPHQQIGLGELGYWESSTTKAWWAMDQTNIRNARRLIVDQYYKGSLAFPTSVGGAFWWCFPDTFPYESKD
jgi:hypothetical protein